MQTSPKSINSLSDKNVKPNLFLVGAAKCGTTSMYHYLRQHPEVFMSELKEPHFFASDLDGSWFIKNEESYLSLFSDATLYRWRGEASVMYLFSEDAASKISDYSPKAKIIIMIRHPVDMMHSWHSQQVSRGDETIRDFRAALALEEVRLRGDSIPPRCALPFALAYRKLAQFSTQIERYLHVFPRENVKVILLDDLKADPAATFADACTFLSIDPKFQPNFKVMNSNKEVRSWRLLNFMRRPPDQLRKITHALTTPAIRQQFGSLVVYLNRTYKPREKLDPEFRRLLITEFQPEIARLSTIIGRDLSAWGDSV